MGPRAKSLGLPLTHYPLKTLLILFPKSYPASKATPAPGVKKPSPSLQPTSTMPHPLPQSHPNGRQGTGPSTGLSIVEVRTGATEAAALPVRPVPAFKLQAHTVAACWHLGVGSRWAKHRMICLWIRPTPLPSHLSFHNGQNKVQLDNL